MGELPRAHLANITMHRTLLIASALLLLAQSVNAAPTRRGDPPVHNVDWGLGMSAEQQALHPAAGDHVHFVWSGYHDVYHIKTKAAYDACDFSDATKLGGASPVAWAVPSDANEGDEFYFSCSVGM